MSLYFPANVSTCATSCLASETLLNIESINLNSGKETPPMEGYKLLHDAKIQENSLCRLMSGVT